MREYLQNLFMLSNIFFLSSRGLLVAQMSSHTGFLENLPMILPLLLPMFNSSLRQHKVPSSWTMADVKPLPKESPLTSCTQLWLISLTAVITRLFERIVYRFELSSTCNDYIDFDQLAYRGGHNSTMALIKCQHTWLKWLDGNTDFVRIFSFDFSKAFDSVSQYPL